MNKTKPPSTEQMVDSYYEYSRNWSIQCAVEIDAEKAEVVVIGGGITGCSTALHLAEKGIDVVVLEANYYGWGASGRSGGQIVNGFSLDLSDMARIVDQNMTQKLWQHSLDSVSYTRQLIEKFDIQCDITMGYLHVANKPSQVREMSSWVEQMAGKYGYYKLNFLNQSELKNHLNSDKYYAGVSDVSSGHLHPLNYCLGVVGAAQKSGAKLYQQARATKVEARGKSRYVHVNNKVIECDQVVYACNAYVDNLCEEINTRIMPVGTYIVATEILNDDVAENLIPGRVAVCDSNFALDYYRLSADNRMLFGGRVSYSTLQPRKLTASLRKRMVNVFPQLATAKIDFSWGGYVAITLNRAPHVGQTHDGSWFSHGYSGHGMALSGYMGKLLAEAINGDNNDIDIFKKIPHKIFPGGKWLRMPSLVLGMSYYRMRDYF